MAVLALTVGLITIVSGQLSLVYAQNGKQSPSKAQNSKKSADKKMAPHKAQKAQSAAARIKHTAQGSTTRNQTLAKAGRNAKQLYESLTESENQTQNENYKLLKKRLIFTVMLELDEIKGRLDSGEETASMCEWLADIERKIGDLIEQCRVTQ